MSFHHINLVEMRKRTPKIAPFLALIVLLSIPLYYLSIIDSSKKLNTTFESSLDSLKDTNNPCSSLGGGADTLRCKENEPDAAAQHHDSAVGEIQGKEIREEAQPAETEPAIASESSDEKCDLFSGEWVPNPEGPYYTNATCYAIQEHQNCMGSGRPDVGYLKWRWKPDECELPIFDPLQFLELVRGKSLAFVGDSVARNHMQSLICLLASKVEYPVDVSTVSDQNFKRWKYANYNFTLANFWTPFLVRYQERDSHGPTHTGLFNLYLDEFDDSWTTQIDDFDYVILNSGHWLTRTAVYYEKRRVVGCHYCQLPNITELKMSYAYRRVFRTALKAINGREHFKGVTFLRTFSPSHFEGGLWNEGGNCVRTRPFRSNETVLEGVGLEFYTIQLEEFSIAERERKKRLRLLDTTHAMLLRPDGHPSRYGHWPDENVTLYNDCVHWCLPGPIDSWADFLFHLLKLEARRS